MTTLVPVAGVFTSKMVELGGVEPARGFLAKDSCAPAPAPMLLLKMAPGDGIEPPMLSQPSG